MDYDYLDGIVLEVTKGNLDKTGVLSSGEILYVALAANSSQLLEKCNYTIAEAIARLGSEDTLKLVERWG